MPLQTGAYTASHPPQARRGSSRHLPAHAQPFLQTAPLGPPDLAAARSFPWLNQQTPWLSMPSQVGHQPTAPAMLPGHQPHGLLPWCAPKHPNRGSLRCCQPATSLSPRQQRPAAGLAGSPAHARLPAHTPAPVTRRGLAHCAQPQRPPSTASPRPRSNLLPPRLPAGPVLTAPRPLLLPLAYPHPRTSQD